MRKRNGLGYGTVHPSSSHTCNCLPSTPYNSMASVSKLVLVPIDPWNRLSKDRKDIDVQSMKTIEIPSVNQLGARKVPSLDPLAKLEGPLVGAGSLPLLSPKEKEEGKGGKEEAAPPKYINREDTSKDKTSIEIETQVYGDLLEKYFQQKACNQVQMDTHIKRQRPHCTPLIDTVA